MKKIWIVSIVLIITMIASSIQDEIKLDCQPTTTTETYPDSMFVFVVDLGAIKPLKLSIGYIIKQIACTIPVAQNIKTYFLDISDETWNKQIENDLKDSQGLIASLETTLATAKTATANACVNHKTVTSKFVGIPAVSSHSNVKYFTLLADSTCPNLAITASEFVVNLKHMQVDTDKVLIMLDKRGSGAIDYNDVVAPEFLKKASLKFVSEALGKTVQQAVHVEAQPIATDSGNTVPTFVFGISAVANGLFLFVVVALLFFLLKKGKHSDDTQKDKKDKKSNDKKGKKPKSLEKSGGNEPSGDENNQAGDQAGGKTNEGGTMTGGDLGMP